MRREVPFRSYAPPVDAAPWADELRALVEGHDGPPLVSLATLAADGSPRARTMVVRGVEDDGGFLTTSHDASAKGDELRRDPRASGVLWFEGERTQFRLRGRIEFVDDPARRGEVWQTMSDTARALFVWPTPGEPKADDLAFVEKIPADAGVPAAFAVLRLVPDSCERLVLSGVPHRRTVWTRDRDGWRSEEVNP